MMPSKVVMYLAAAALAVVITHRDLAPARAVQEHILLLAGQFAPGLVERDTVSTRASDCSMPPGQPVRVFGVPAVGVNRAVGDAQLGVGHDQVAGRVPAGSPGPDSPGKRPLGVLKLKVRGSISGRLPCPLTQARCSLNSMSWVGGVGDVVDDHHAAAQFQRRFDGVGQAGLGAVRLLRSSGSS